MNTIHHRPNISVTVILSYQNQFENHVLGLKWLSKSNQDLSKKKVVSKRRAEGLRQQNVKTVRQRERERCESVNSESQYVPESVTDKSMRVRRLCAFTIS